jgi:hypothetical protein
LWPSFLQEGLLWLLTYKFFLNRFRNPPSHRGYPTSFDKMFAKPRSHPAICPIHPRQHMPPENGSLLPIFARNDKTSQPTTRRSQVTLPFLNKTRGSCSDFINCQCQYLQFFVGFIVGARRQRNSEPLRLQMQRTEQRQASSVSSNKVSAGRNDYSNLLLSVSNANEDASNPLATCAA